MTVATVDSTAPHNIVYNRRLGFTLQMVLTHFHPHKVTPLNFTPQSYCKNDLVSNDFVQFIRLLFEAWSNVVGQGRKWFQRCFVDCHKIVGIPGFIVPTRFCVCSRSGNENFEMVSGLL